MKDLGSLNHISPNATAKDFDGYPSWYRKSHPERNHPELIRFLIKKYSSEGDRLHDPQVGSGTVLIECDRVGRIGSGWDLVPEFREDLRWWPMISHPTLMDLVISSPSYWGTTHERGNSLFQEEIQASVGSMQGAGWGDVTLPDNHLANSRKLSSWIKRVIPIIRGVYESLRPGGVVAWIVRNRIVVGSEFDFVTLNKNLLEESGLEVDGVHWRKIIPTANQQLQARKFSNKHGYRPPMIDREGSLIARKKS